MQYVVEGLTGGVEVVELEMHYAVKDLTGGVEVVYLEMHYVVEGLTGGVEVVGLELHYVVRGLTGGFARVIVYFALGQKEKFEVVKKRKKVVLTGAELKDLVGIDYQ